MIVAAAVLAAAVGKVGVSAHVAMAQTGLNNASAACDRQATVIGVRGSGDPQSGDVKTDKYGLSVHGMGKPGATFAVDLANDLPRGDVTFLPTIYPAVGLLGDWRKVINLVGAGLHVGILGAYTASVNDGKRMLLQEISDEERLCPNIKLVLVGYSQGAQVVGDVYQRNLTSEQRSRIAGVVLFGDPYFNPVDPAAEGSYDPTRRGVLGKRPLYPVNRNARVFSICHIYDPICQGPGRDNFSAHGNYQADSWVSTAAAKIAALLHGTSTLPASMPPLGLPWNTLPPSGYGVVRPTAIKNGGPTANLENIRWQNLGWR